jgi:hypothetical protein
MRSRKRGQAIVEFGVVALLFTSLLFAVIDFGLLLNTWLSVSSASREIARSASVGKGAAFLRDEASRLNVPAISTAGFTGLCCDASSAIEVQVEYLSGSFAPYLGSSVAGSFPYPNVDSGGGCSDPAPPASPVCHPLAGDLVRVTLRARGAQVITPLIRPFFGCTNGADPNCNVHISSTTLMRFEGRGI